MDIRIKLQHWLIIFAAVSLGALESYKPATAQAITTVTGDPQTSTILDADDPEPITERVNAQYEGIQPYDSFTNGRLEYDTWTYGDIIMYTPPGEVDINAISLWMAWYQRHHDLYRQLMPRDNFEQVFQRTIADFGSRKVIGFPPDSCGAGCGNKLQAEAPGLTNTMMDDVEDYVRQWIVFYEFGRGGQAEAFYGKATWPTNTVILPHLMAGVGFYAVGGGDDGMEKGIPGDLLNELDRWEQSGKKYVEHFTIPDQQSQDGFTSHHLMPAILMRILQETDDYNVIRDILFNMSTKPEPIDATVAMCDFQSAINDATNNQFSSRLTSIWGLPSDCSSAEPVTAVPGSLSSDWPLDLADIVGGGDGSLPGTATADTATTSNVSASFVETRNAFIDGVFVPHGSRNSTISTTGLSTDLTGLNSYLGIVGFPANGYGDVASISGMTLSNLVMPDLDKIQDHSILNMHASKGVTFDLNAIEVGARARVSRFTSTVVGPTPANTSYAIFIDGVEVAAGQLLGKAAAQIDINIAANARFLTLVSGDNRENTINNKHVVFIDPFLLGEADNTPGDLDSDGDGLSDNAELTIHGTNPNDSDTDDDGLSDSAEINTHSTNPIEADTDADGISDGEEIADGTNPLVDNSDTADLDVDKDGIPNDVEGSGDQDGDGLENFADTDSDNDGIADIIEAGGVDADNNAMVDNFVDANSDGLDDAIEALPLPVSDTDGDGLANYLDLDSDQDGISDLFEAGGTDADSNGLIDDLTDANNDGRADDVVTNPLPLADTDTDSIPNYLDLDSDSDNRFDLTEAGGEDVDNDGIVDTFLDSDSDGIPDVADVDSTNGTDSDSDGIDDTADASITLGDDINGNGVDDSVEADADGNGIADAALNTTSLPDEDRDGVIDLLDFKSEAAISTAGGCSINAAETSRFDPLLIMITFASVGLVFRRRFGLLSTISRQ